MQILSKCTQQVALLMTSSLMSQQADHDIKHQIVWFVDQ